ncbi:MAG: DUF4230 domain-containing protein [Solirubrobacteraceae bacterium]
MLKTIQFFFAFIIGIAVAYLFLKNSEYRKKVTEENYAVIISQKIEQLNKLVVEEDNLAEIYTYKNAKNFLGEWISFDKKIVLLTKAKIQASYDMKKMEVKIDSINQIIYINKVPQLKVEVFSDTQFYDFEQSNFNKFNKEEINRIKKKAINKLVSKINKKELEKRTRVQLIKNLSEIYLLAKIYGWQIKDNTIYQPELIRINAF